MQIKLVGKLLGLIISSVILIVGCAKFEPAAPAKEDILDGPMEGLSNEQRSQFLRGDANVNEVFTSSIGLGPLFVAASCISCHAGDGKGTLSTTLIRFGQSDTTGNRFLHLGGPQLQNRAIQGFHSEQIPVGATFAKFTPPAITGLGFLQYVTDQSILALADPGDTDGDGISGVPNWSVIPNTITPSINAVTNNGKYLCRFGKKASAYDLLHQTVNAYNQDMGITSVFDPMDVYSGLAIDPEVSMQKINDVVFYLKTLKAPIQRQADDAEVLNGKNIFVQSKCSSCHIPQLQTGYSPIASLSNKIFYPYTDLLLHDMGSDLDDGYTEGSAMTYEWRTPPLWGLGLSSGSQGGQYFLMHDGRARSIEEAIEMHGGEATQSKNNFKQLSQSERNTLIKFLKSL